MPDHAGGRPRKPICKDCPPNLRRPAPNPGPRCATHWREELRRRAKATHERRVLTTYGLGPGDYDRLYDYQERRCPICRRATGKTRKLSVDHDHKSGAVRGLLCRPCNTMLGHGRDDPQFFIRAAVYLIDPPYPQLNRGGAPAERLQELPRVREGPQADPGGEVPDPHPHGPPGKV
ncbi:endonuclease VII domain-containing protein [Streptomyces sp. NPDC015131]|uniref:endonuclease VII domain-containing protein n=1 Tax=Streptomyces sp. NPDC015131 TaxID=3364941 RepID=UPI0036FA0465